MPDDVEVRMGGVTVFGSVDCEAACDGAGPDGRDVRVVEVEGNGGFGSIEVVTRDEASGGE